MPQFPIPSVMDGPLSQEQETAIWRAVSGMSTDMAQPLTGWALLANVFWVGKRAMSAEMAEIMGVSHKTWAAGLPKKPAKLRRALDKFDRHIHATLAQATPECAARRERALVHMLKSIREDPATTPCGFFHQTLGIAGGDGLEALAVRVDGVSKAILTQTIRPDEIPHAIVEAAVEAGEIPAGSVATVPDLDSGLDATLMLMARLDRDCFSANHLEQHHIVSLFGLLVDMSHPTPSRNARWRLLDLYYALAIKAEGQRLPHATPSIRQLEDMLLGGPPESGGQSWIVRWRNGNKKIRFEDVQTIALRVAERSSFDFDHLFRLLWLSAQFWSMVECGGPQAVRRAGERYRAWWDAMDSPGLQDAVLADPYWNHFRPYA